MGCFLRVHQKESIHFVTNRCEHEMFFLLPTPILNLLVLFWLAKAKNRFGNSIELYAFVFMSNHFHLLLQDPEGQLPEFMCYFQGNLARTVNRILKRSGHFWSREYDDVIVDGEEEFWNRYAYIIGNPVKAGLTATAEQWKGVSSFSCVLKSEPISATSINLGRYNDARRFNRKVNKKDFEETHSFELAVPPMLADKTANEQRRFVKELIASSCKQFKKDRLYKPALGMKKVLAQNPFDRPKKPARRPRFKFFSLSKTREKELKKIYRSFVSTYKNCLQQLIEYFRKYQGRLDWENANLRCVLKAPSIIWPTGSYPPTCHNPVLSGISVFG